MERKTSRLRENETYTHKDHKEWAKINNYRVTHFGIHPNQLKRKNIMFDVMHMQMEITKKMIEYTRTFVISQSTDFIELFKIHLKEFWGQFHLFLWNNN